MLTRLWAVMAIVCLSASTAHAIDWGVMQLDTDYNVESFQPYDGTFTAPETGTLKIISKIGTEKITEIYTDATFKKRIEGVHSGWTANPQYYAYKVTAGTTYYIHSDWAWDADVIRLEMEKADAGVEFDRADPAEGSALSISDGYGYIDLYFSGNLGSVTSCRLTCDGTTITMRATPSNNTLSIEYVAALNKLYAAGVKGGAAITISIEGLKSKSGVLYNGDGKFSLSYTLANKAVTLESSQLPQQFKSYWAPGDPDAVATFTFSGDLSTSMNASTVRLEFGSTEVEGNEYYVEEVPFTVEGNILKVDFAGVRRTPADMVASGTNYGNVVLRLVGLRDADNQFIASTGQGTIGSFSFDWIGKYLVIEKGTVIADFTPSNGTTLANATEISVWMQGSDCIKFDGFTLTAEDNGEVTEANVPMSEVTVATEDDGKAYTFAIPASIKGKKGVTVTLTNVQSLDGYDHSSDVSASYDKFVITNCDPANGAQMETLAEGTILTVTTNYNELYPDLYMVYEIEDLNPDDPDEAIIKSESWLTRQSDGNYTSEVYGTYKLMKDHKYAVRFTAWASEMDKNYQEDPVGTAEVYWYGLTAPFEYSQLSLVSIEPDPETTVLSPDMGEFILTFDGSVNIKPEDAFILEGMSMTRPFDSVEPINGSHESEGIIYNDQWKLTISESFLSSWDAALQFSVKAYDEDGLIVRGNQGKEENTYFLFDYNMTTEYKEATVSPAEMAEYDSLKQFTVSFEGGINQSWAEGLECYVMDLTNRTRYELDITMGEGDYTTGNDVMYLTLAEEITTPGTYVLHADAGFFMLGSEFSSWKSAEINAYYYVKEPEIPGEDDTRVVTPNPATTGLKELSQVDIIFSDYSSAGIGGGKATLAIGNAEPINLPDAEYGKEWNEVVQPLGQTYTADATYTISFPAGYFTLGDSGKDCKAFVLVYTIGGTSGITSIAADANGKYNVYKLNGVRVLSTENGNDISKLATGVYVINGKKVYVK